jgi:CheY-like chemotaxis protein
MILQALLVSKDDGAAETLIQVQAQFGVAVDRCSASDVALARLKEQHFDQVIVDFDADFDNPKLAAAMIESCKSLSGPDRKPPVTVALLHDASQIRSILGEGAHFILTKPLTHEQVQNTLRAATSLLKRERRQSARVAVQAPVSMQTEGSSAVEAILLDLSIGGMDVLAAKPLPIAALVHVSFDLPDIGTTIVAEAEVAWSTPNGQTGLRFLDLESKLRDAMAAWLAAHSHDALPEEPAAVSRCNLTDLSLGGCYVQTESPFPQASAVDLCLRAAGMEIHAEGLVRVMHPGNGMGIEFPARTEEQRKSVGEFIEFLTSQPGATPQLEISPRSLVASDADLRRVSPEGEQSDDPLLELLRSGQSLEEEAFLGALHKQRTPTTVSQ